MDFARRVLEGANGLGRGTSLEEGEEVGTADKVPEQGTETGMLLGLNGTPRENPTRAKTIDVRESLIVKDRRPVGTGQEF